MPTRTKTQVHAYKVAECRPASKTRWLFLADAPPLPDRPGGHFVARNFCEGFPTGRTIVLTRRFSRRYSPSVIRKACLHPATLWHDASQIGLRRPWPAVRGIVDNLLFRLQFPHINSLLRPFRPTRIFALAGADIFFLPIATKLAQELQIPLDVYLVDDFLASARLNSDRLSANFAKQRELSLLGKADRVWAISPGYVEHLQITHGCPAKYLPVPMPARRVDYHPPTYDSVRRIVFAGSINPLYFDALREVYACLAKLNERGASTEFRLTIFTPSVVPDLVLRLGGSQYLDYFPDRPMNERHAALRSCYAILLPYSFLAEVKLMVSTSFSCKIGEAFASGRPILVYGPPYGSIPRHFRDNALPQVVTDPALLREGILGIEQIDTPVTIAKYAAFAKATHDPSEVVRMLEA